MTERLSIAVAGASGFVGKHLIPRLTAAHDVVALGRSVTDGEPWRGTDAVARRCDLFSLKDAERALEGIDVAIYLVHSMMPTARLTQSSFEDMDAVLADNFARAAASCNVRQIIFLSGLVPADDELSAHLRSRIEVERLLAARGVPVTVLRAGLVVGPGGSSFRILQRLVERLPVMACPRWTQTRTQPIALDDVVELIVRCVAREDVFGGVFDVGGRDVLTYREMIERTAKAMGVERRTIAVPVLTPGLSTLWVSLVTGTSRELVGPLVQSLRHTMVARDDTLMRRLGMEPVAFDDAVRDAVRGEALEDDSGARSLVGRRTRPDVRSIQRLPQPQGFDADDITMAYMRWLPRFCWPWLRVRVNDERVCRFEFAPLGLCLLELTYSADRSRPDRALLYITSGVLAQTREGDRDRLEFRTLPDGRSVLAAIHDFRPALPWLLYKLTQAQAHLFVMSAFARHLASLVGRDAAARRAPAKLLGGED